VEKLKPISKKYLTGCAKAFRTGYIDINQFTLAK